MLTEVLTAVGVLVATAALDFAATGHIRAVSAKNWHAAGMWSVAMTLLATVSLLALVDVSRLMIAPECLGLYAGTRLAGWAEARGAARRGRPIVRARITRMNEREKNVAKKVARRAAVVGLLLALACHLVPDDYRAACEMVAQVCRGGF